MSMPKLHVGYFEIPEKQKNKKTKKNVGNHSQRKASEHLIYSVRGRSMKTFLGCNYFDSKYQTDRHEV